MKKSKKYKISVGLFCVSILLLCLAAIIGIFGGNNTSIDKVCLYLGFSSLCFGSVLLKKSKENNDNKDK